MPSRPGPLGPYFWFEAYRGFWNQKKTDEDWKGEYPTRMVNFIKALLNTQRGSFRCISGSKINVSDFCNVVLEESKYWEVGSGLWSFSQFVNLSKQLFKRWLTRVVNFVEQWTPNQLNGAGGNRTKTDQTNKQQHLPVGQIQELTMVDSSILSNVR